MSEAISRVGELALVICLIYGLALIPSFAAWTSDLDTGLISYYKTDEASGTVISDSLNTNNGTISGATVNQPGKIGKTYDYDGTNDYTYIPNTKGLNLTGNFTLSFWLNMTGDEEGGFLGTALPTPQTGWMSYWMTAGNYIGFFGYGLTGTTVQTTTGLTQGTWYHIVVTYNGTNMAIWLNGVIEDNNARTGALTGNALDVWIARYHHSDIMYHDMEIDEIGIWDVSLTPAQITQLYNSGTGITYIAPSAIISGLNYPVANMVNASLGAAGTGTITNAYWNFGDGTEGYSAGPNVTHNYTTAGYFTVNATVTIDASNYTSSNLNRTVYSPLTAVTVTPASYVPFLAISSVVNLTTSATGGTPYQNASWTFTLSNGTAETATTTNRTYYEKTASAGIYYVSAMVCDKTYVACATNTTSFNAWNITGGVFAVNSSNKTSNLMAEVFEGDNVTFISTTSLAWNLSGYTISGTSATFVFNNTYDFFESAHYLHFNVSVTNTWGAYTASTYFTVIGAKYNITTSTCSNQTLNCFLIMKMYNELTEAQLTTGTTWSAYIETAGQYGHSKSIFVNTNATALNISYCINATPLVALSVGGQVIYSATNYAERTYSFLDAPWPVTCTTCSISDGNLISVYTRTNTTTSIITFNVLDGGASLPNALVKIQGNFNTSDTWKTIASQVSDEGGQVQFYLAYCPTYYKIIVEYGGAVVYTEKTCLKDSVINLNIDTSLPEVFEVLGDISTTCSWLNSTEVVSCLISDPTGRTIQSTLNVYPAWTTSASCTTSEASTSTTLYCDMSSALDGDYAWELDIETAEDTYPVNTGHFTIGTTESFSTDGTILVMVLLLVVFLGSRMSPVVMILVGTVGIILIGQFGLITMSGGFVAWLIVLALVAIGGMI